MDPDPSRMTDIAAAQSTVSDKIRALDAAGYARADIARFLGKRYQHVRNVLVDDSQRGGSGYVLGRADLSGVREGPAPFERDDDNASVQARGNGAYRLVVQTDGSVVLPKEVVEAFDVGPGVAVMARLQGDEFTLISAATAMDRVRALVRRVVPRGAGLADELITERRADAERDHG